MIEKLVCMKDLQYIGGNYEANGVHKTKWLISTGTISFDNKRVNCYARIVSSTTYSICGFENEEDRIDYANFLRKNIRLLAPRIFCRCVAKLLYTLFMLYFICKSFIYVFAHDFPSSSIFLTILVSILCVFVVSGVHDMIDSI